MEKALFLDRDGVINVEKNYVYRIEDFEFVEGIFELCRCAQELDFRLVIITNQAGIARGFYTVQDYEKLTAWMLEQFSLQKVHIDRTYYCPFHPTAGIGIYRRSSLDRKPSPGMILRAKEDLNLDLSMSALIGDKRSDIEAGQSAGIGNNILLSPTLAVSDSVNVKRFASLTEISEWFGRTFHHLPAARQ